MAVQYRLTLAGDIPAEQVAECAVVDPAERPQPTQFGGTLSARLYDQYGFALSVTPGRNGYYDALDDDGSRWEWELDAYVDVDFRTRADDLVDKAIPHMLTMVAQVLNRRREDAALVQDGSLLLATRVDGVLRKHNRARWWDHYGFVNDILPS
jgi:hypothetical protein